jgi:RNA polymerase sigma factor (sigma-70 family)
VIQKWLRSPVERVGSLADAALPPPAPSTDDDRLLTRALQHRDEAAFATLLDRFYAPMLRVARTYVRSVDEAEEVVQDTWLAVLGGIDRFEGRSSLKTWIFRILVNRARSRATREARSVPLSALQAEGSPPGDDSLESVLGRATPLWAGSGAERGAADHEVLAGELRAQIDQAIHALPPRQQQVITLRDVHDWSAGEVCALLDISDANQRIILHRARAQVRRALSRYLGDPAADSDPKPALVH